MPMCLLFAYNYLYFVVIASIYYYLLLSAYWLFIVCRVNASFCYSTWNNISSSELFAPANIAVWQNDLLRVDHITLSSNITLLHLNFLGSKFHARRPRGVCVCKSSMTASAEQVVNDCALQQALHYSCEHMLVYDFSTAMWMPVDRREGGGRKPMKKGHHQRLCASEGRVVSGGHDEIHVCVNDSPTACHVELSHLK